MIFKERLRYPVRLTILAASAILSCITPGAATPALAAKKPVPALVALPVAPPTPETLAMIDAALREGRLDAAREAIGRSWASGSTEVQLRGAELALASGSLAEAADGFGQLIDDPLLGARAAQGLGVTQLRQGKTSDAVKSLDAALARDPTLVRAWNARGVAADRLQDWPASDNAYDKALALAPDAADILSNRGYSQMLRQHFSAAETDFARAVMLDPKLPAARTNLRIARAMQGRYEEAFQGATKLTLADDLNTVGYAAMARGDLAVAEAYFNRAMSLNPNFDRAAWANLQYLKSLQGKPAGDP
ncbi:tetratricopeptide repeat protein [Sandarakinorhabdus sp.]|uniref:tetratricopeptide repeat protein n=1 Tax=Sandarakinorhabdus sp. TaxID=1916663 RepID=UPI00286DD3D1|nr:tetratricopeptide repeat protein [Sandarakinorhabdus sp.]